MCSPFVRGRITPGVLGLVVACLAGSAHADLITFEDLPNLPARTTFSSLSGANNGSSTIHGVTFDPNFSIVGDRYVEAFNNSGGNDPFAKPHSGHYALFANFGADGMLLTTTQILTGAWFGRSDTGTGPVGTDQVTVRRFTIRRPWPRSL